MRGLEARVVACLAAAAMLNACGSPSGTGGAGNGVTFQAVWEQTGGAGALVTGAAPDHNFGSTIPPAVNTVRITLESAAVDGPPSCCIAVPRGSRAFAERSLILSSILPGDTTVSITGYPTSYAPADGILRGCPTNPEGAGTSCDVTRSALPSFDSDGVDVTVVGGERSDVGLIEVYSMPFLVDVAPAAGASVTGPTFPVSVAIVDAINNVVPGDVSVSVEAGVPSVPVPFNVGVMDPCDEQVAAPATPCTAGSDLAVAGYTLSGTTDPVEPGIARVTITASNDGSPPRSLAYSYEVTVVTPTTTTSTTTSSTVPGSTVTSSTVTSTTVTSSTTTTLPAPLSCTVSFGLTTGARVAGLTIDVDYARAAGDFTGSGAAVACRANDALNAFGAYNDNDAARIMRIGLLSAVDFAGPVKLADCDFVGLPAPQVGDFDVTVVESFAADLSVVGTVPAAISVTCAQ